MKSFQEWNKIFSTQNLFEFNNDKSGIMWLKIKSLIRKDILDFIQKRLCLNLQSKTQQEKFEELYNLVLSKHLDSAQIDTILCEYNTKEIADIQSKFKDIESELYKMTYFAWGGDSTNSLDKYIVSVIKNTYKYSDILYKIDNNIAENVKNYTLSSWYNNWTTILTEHIFKSHKRVISSVGKIKSVDFFIEDIPIDLKITYFPKEFLKLQRKNNHLDSEVVLLKKIAREHNLVYDRLCKEEIIKYQIMQQILDSHNAQILTSLREIQKQNTDIIQESIQNKNILTKWLYENQGEMRFGSENRLFIVFVDFTDSISAWKLKRNFALIQPRINSYLDNFDRQKFLNNIISFSFKQRDYKTLADIIFIYNDTAT